jgi:DNA-binding LacI/PurR family transcriptional regulator
MKSSAPTIKDVARRAGVSYATASVVLNNSARTNTRVSTATRERVRAVAAALHYQPNAVAQSLRRRRTHILGFYGGTGNNIDVRSPFVAQIVAGLQQGCEDHAMDLLVHGKVAGRPVDAVYAEVGNGKIDGLVLYTVPSDPLIALLADSHLPAIAVADAVSELPSVVVDDAAAGRLQAEHLAGKGHRRVLYLPGPLDSTQVNRCRTAFCEAATGLGITVVQGTPGRNDSLSDRERAILTGAAGPRPTAMVAWADDTAHPVLAECLEMGLRVPQDLAVVGFDDNPLRVQPLWRLTTIRADWWTVARTAVSLLVSRIEGREVPPETVLPVELVVGNTT